MKHVWLPTMRVWAQAHEVPQEGVASDDAEPSTGMIAHLRSSIAQRREDSWEASSSSIAPETLQYYRRRDRNRHGDHNPLGDRGCQNHFRGQGDSKNGNSSSRNHRSKLAECCDGSSVCDEPHQTCPICLIPITQSELSVLRWCMHRFCITCIEKWSSMQCFCPLCKQKFHGWYYNIQSSSSFDKVDLAIQSSWQPSLRRRQPLAQRRGERSRVSTPLTSRPLPWRRTLRTTWDPRQRVTEGRGDDQALQWRASIYKRNLKAIPFVFNKKVRVHQAPLSDPERRSRIERRLEPWIHRELQAILGDLDHSLLIHLVLSLWLQCLSQKEGVSDMESSGQSRTVRTGIADAELIRQLEPFLQGKASTFWHELRCFAESPYSLRAYDSVIKYERSSG